ncbi:hypothetical protein N7532_002587 [Penicillium argentinense]|uniref:HhH-GPD domain-containing protein n=1 Tax=Penicillium argentinense TaxID=1131581 RepID=A0A9W9G285_9EURO|nr:uncharacterized protein N7532_002587 [Penicillium argentinense]KAJ5109942.1 hypothetical protein N7532_002587 [Penicillium argentinense]
MKNAQPPDGFGIKTMDASTNHGATTESPVQIPRKALPAEEHPEGSERAIETPATTSPSPKSSEQMDYSEIPPLHAYFTSPSSRNAQVNSPAMEQARVLEQPATMTGLTFPNVSENTEALSVKAEEVASTQPPAQANESSSLAAKPVQSEQPPTGTTTPLPLTSEPTYPLTDKPVTERVTRSATRAAEAALSVAEASAEASTVAEQATAEKNASKPKEDVNADDEEKEIRAHERRKKNSQPSVKQRKAAIAPKQLTGKKTEGTKKKNEKYQVKKKMGKRKSPSKPKADAKDTPKKAKKLVNKTPNPQELPHNQGPAPTAKSSVPEVTDLTAGSDKENEKAEDEKVEDENATTQSGIPDGEAGSISAEKLKPKREKKAPYLNMKLGKTPFPDWKFPTPDQCKEVNDILTFHDCEKSRPEEIPKASRDFAGCGEVPFVLDALIRTLLSGATTGSNAAVAYVGLVKKFGTREHGLGKGSVDWEAVQKAELREIFIAIKGGGLADIKSKNIKGLLDWVQDENTIRRDTLRAEVTEIEAQGVQDGDLQLKKNELACLDDNILSLEHLHALSTQDAMSEMIKYPGIGPKTAACVLLFCMQRPCFAVDTHIFRLAGWLGWIPIDRATEVSGFLHLDTRIPDEYKYSLHWLLIRHGKMCPRCRAATGEKSANWDQGCPLEDLLTRTGKRKGGSELVSRRKKRTKTSKGKRITRSQKSAGTTKGTKSPRANDKAKIKKTPKGETAVETSERKTTGRTTLPEVTVEQAEADMEVVDQYVPMVDQNDTPDKTQVSTKKQENQTLKRFEKRLASIHGNESSRGRRRSARIAATV